MTTSAVYSKLSKPNLASTLFQPLTVKPIGAKHVKIDNSKSPKLMCDMGIIRQAQTGIFHLLPLGLRAINKLKSLIDLKMRAIGAQEMSIPLIVDGDLWKKSGRWSSIGPEVFRFKDRHNNDHLLSPTNEESAADLIASIPQLSHHQFPLRLYQMAPKFRDELKPRCGLIRGREFLMKDLYCFDTSLEEAWKTYDAVTEVYNEIFDQLELKHVRVEADTGDIGGISSHEYHLICSLGEEKLQLCSSCGSTACNCTSPQLHKVTGLEVGHTFLLGEKYSEPLQAVFRTTNNTSQPLIMSSYGLGLSRILAASVEIMSTDEEIRWPTTIAPFLVAIVPAKEGSHEFTAIGDLPLEMYHRLQQIPELTDNVLLDDRGKMTIGKRILHWKRTGFPYVVVVGSKATSKPPIFEIIDVHQNKVTDASLETVLNFFDEHSRRATSCINS